MAAMGSGMKDLTLNKVVLISLILTFCLLAGCGGSPEAGVGAGPPDESYAADTEPADTGPADTSDTGGAESESAFIFMTNQTEIAPGGNFAPVLTALGEPTDIFEAPSCAFDGVDRIYYYPGFVINTFPDQGADCVLSVYFTDDSVETQEGIYLGASYDDLISVYGEGLINEAGDMLRFVRGETSLTFLLDGDTVRDISYYFDPAQTLVDMAE
jgi:hypothetical protein